MASQIADVCISDSIEVFDPKPLAAVACGVHPPIVASFNDRIRPLLDCIDKLRHLNIMQEGIQLPTIVVVGDQSSGKSSVLESLAGISLPRGQGICTRVPLVMRLQNDPNITAPHLQLEYNNKSLPVDEVGIADAIILATDEIAGHGKGISNYPLTLVVKKNGVPDLTMVDLPGITRVAVQGQPEDIYEQIYDIIMKYIVPEESIILNVLSATVDFPTCESIRMSQKVDKTGERTLAVVTKADKAPEGLLEKVTADEVNIGLGYVCVRNRIGNESYEEARSDEERFFSTHPLLSKIDKSMVTVPVLAQKLVRIQASIISKCLPEIVRKINDKLAANLAELNRLPQHLTSVAEALTAFMHILSSSKDSLKKILVSGEFDEYPEEKEMHSAARLVEMLEQYSNELHSKNCEKAEEFLMEEIMVLQEAKGIGLPNFLPRAVFLNVLQRKVKEIAASPEEFVGKLWNYLERVVIRVLMYHCENYPQLQSSTRRAAQNLIAKKKNESVDWVWKIIEMEKLTDYTCNPDYLAIYSKLVAQQHMFMEIMNDRGKPSVINLAVVGEIDVRHLRKHLDVVQQGFDLKMRMMAYWVIVLARLVDSMALHIMFSIQNMINKEMEDEIIQDMMAPHGGGIERMLDESPLVAEKRNRLKKSVKLLKESKEVMANIMDRISLHDDHERQTLVKIAEAKSEKMDSTTQAPAKKNPKKANLLDHHSIKTLLDESVSEIVTSKGYPEDVRLSNLRLLMGSIIIAIALVAQFYKKEFPANRDFLIGCIVLYILFNVILQLIIHTKEKNGILFTYPPEGSFNSTGLIVSSKLPRFSDMYTLTVESADPKSISARPKVEFTKSVTKWFTKDGVLVEGLFWKDVEAVVNDYAKEHKKSK